MIGQTNYAGLAMHCNAYFNLDKTYTFAKTVLATEYLNDNNNNERRSIVRGWGLNPEGDKTKTPDSMDCTTSVSTLHWLFI